MKRGLLGVLGAGVMLMWFAAPVWSDEAVAPKAYKEQAVAQEPAVQPIQTPVAVQQPEPAVAKTNLEDETPPSQMKLPAVEQRAAVRHGIHIKDAVVCQEVVDRLPIGTGDVFDKKTGTIFCFTRVVGLEDGGDIFHNWYYKGTLKSSTRLTVGSSNWRTWSYKSINPEFTGEWMVEVLTEDGMPLESIIFFIQ